MAVAQNVVKAPIDHNMSHWQERVDLAASFRWTARLNLHEAVANHFSLSVNGDGTHPLWPWLKAEAPGVLGSEAIKWNFTKFLVGRDGRVIRRYAPTDTPESLARDIEAALAA